MLLEINRQSIYCKTYGDKNHKPILFGHSFLWNSDLMWHDQIKFLSKEYYCVTVDLPGHGRSGDFPPDMQQYTLPQLAEDYKLIMDQLGIEQALIVGLSVGGMWGAHLAVKYPERVAGLVLMNTDLGEELPVRQTEYLELIHFIEKNGMTFEMIENIASYFFTKKNLNKNISIVSEFKNSLKDLSADRIATIANLGKAIFKRESLLEALKLMKIPTCIIAGAEDISRVPEESKIMASLIPEAQCTIVKGAAHVSSVEQPEVINKILGEFFESLK